MANPSCLSQPLNNPRRTHPATNTHRHHSIPPAAASQIPPPLIRQLKPGGRMVIPVGNPFQPQTLVLVTKGNKGPRDIQVRSLMPVAFVPLVGGPNKK